MRRTSAKEPAVKVRGVGYVEDVLGTCEKRGREAGMMANGRVAVRLRAPEHVRFADRRLVCGRAHPHEPLLLATREHGHVSPSPARLAREHWNAPADALCVILPAVIRALDAVVEEASARERDVAMGAPVEKGVGLTGLPAEEYDGRVEERARERCVSELPRAARHVPVPREAVAGETPLRLGRGLGVRGRL
jgi:hypothetical protein